MPAAYYDIKVQEGSSFKLDLNFRDTDSNVVVLKGDSTSSPAFVIPIPKGYEDLFDPFTNMLVLAKMQVRSSVNGSIVGINKIYESDDFSPSLVGETRPGRPNATPIDITLTKGKSAVPNTTPVTYKEEPNIKIRISPNITKRINYGNYLYDLELYFYQNTLAAKDVASGSSGLGSVVIRILQGRFIVSPSITRGASALP